MNYSGIIYDDIANGPGIRTSLFVSGCRNNCPGCFNKDQQNFNYGQEFTDEVADKILDTLDDEFHTGISLLGGEPMEPENARVLLRFIKKLKDRYPDKNVWIYSGYTYEYLDSLLTSQKELLELCDVIVDGCFEEKLKDISLAYRGSSNQRIIDVKKTKKSRNIVELQY